jgi:hypothetical protein
MTLKAVTKEEHGCAGALRKRLRTASDNYFLQSNASGK